MYFTKSIIWSSTLPFLLRSTWERQDSFCLLKAAILITKTIHELWKEVINRAAVVLYGGLCLVPRPHYYTRPMRFGSRGPRKSPGRSSRIRHRNALTKRAWKDAVRGLGNGGLIFSDSRHPPSAVRKQSAINRTNSTLLAVKIRCKQRFKLIH